MHPDCEPLRPLVGTWAGAGEVHYPTMAPRAYAEVVEITAGPKPFLRYTQRTSTPDGTTPMHAETGYLRPSDGGRVEMVLVQPTGLVEIHEGTFDGRTLALELRTLAGTSTAKLPEAVRRRFTVSDGVLSYDLWMAYLGHPLTHHLHANLHEQP